MLSNPSFTPLLIFSILLLGFTASKLLFAQNSSNSEEIPERLKVAEQELRKAQKNLKIAQTENNKLSKEIQIAKDQVVKLQTENTSLSKKKSELENDKQNLTKELKLEKQASSNLKTENNSLNAKLIELEVNKQALIEELNGTYGETDKELLTWVWMTTKVKSLILEKNNAQTEREKLLRRN
ncbi:hypothetical protein NDA01_05425 [Trichocoleus desertorum AS-A10]|uniref:hypothetical protein n=1 Tax=Trichocoleus desertorum TaxID=1481672 RepID=UPI00329A2721